MKNLPLLRSALLVPVFVLFAAPLAHAVDTVPVHAFVREGCIHCAEEKKFFTEVLKERDDIDLIYHEITEAPEREMFDAIAKRANLSKSTPITYIGGEVVQGFATAETTGKHLLAIIDAAKKKDELRPLDDFLTGTDEVNVSRKDSGCEESPDSPCQLDETAFLVHIPLIGAVNLQAYSLPVITAILGLVDGFNPCAMWVLVTFLLILLQLNDRKKVWQVAGLFIAAETVMYYMILNIWFTTWDFIGLDKYVTPIVGLVAIGAGAFFLYEAYSSDGTCKVTSAETRRKTQLRIKDIAAMPFTIVSAIAVIGLALSVNIIEFACSIGIPQTFTKILDINELNFVERQIQMLIYIFMYMIDDFIVFGLALWSTEHMHMTQKYARASNVLGGVLMVILGLLLIFYPQALRFA